MNAPTPLLDLATQTARAHQLDPALVCAVVEQESAWNPWSMRYEPAFFSKYVAPQYTSNKFSASEAYARAFSWGLMQIMGEVAREFGFGGMFLSNLCDPVVGLDWGCRKLAKCLANAQGDVPRALIAWNGGSNQYYAAEVQARIPTYRVGQELGNNSNEVQQAAAGEN